MAKISARLILHAAAGFFYFVAQPLFAQEPSSWWTSQVDRSIPYWATSLALDRDGNAHIAYHDYQLGTLKYASKKSGSWVIETVEFTENTGEFVSLALDANENLYIAYTASSGGSHKHLKLATKTERGWVTENVDTGAPGCCHFLYSGFYASLALDDRGHPHIAYYDNSELADGRPANNLKFASKTADGWAIETVDSNGDVGKFASLAFDAKGNPHISYTYTYGGGRYSQLRYASKRDGKWTVESVTTLGRADGNRYYGSLAIDPDGDPHIAYFEMTEWLHKGHLNYVRKSGRNWVDEIVDSGEEAGEYARLALDSERNPHIAYESGTTLKYARKSGGRWKFEIVDSAGAAFVSLALDSYGNPRMTYWGSAGVGYASTAIELSSADPDWRAGASRTITWHGDGPVDMFLSRDRGATWIPLARNLTGGVYSVAVPNLPTDSAKLKLVRSTPYSVAITDGVFNIAP